MDSQVTTTQNAYMSTLKDQVVMANKVVTQAVEWTVAAQQMQEAAKKERDSAKTTKTNSKVIKIGIPFFAFYIVLRFLVFLGDMGLNVDNVGVYILGLLLIAAICVAVWLIPFNAQSHLDKAEECEKKAQENINSANMLIQKYSDCLSVIPQKYWYPLATGYIAEVISNGRATTIPIALDKLEEQIHRWNMEQSMQQQIALQIAQTELLRRIEINTTTSVIADVADLFL